MDDNPPKKGSLLYYVSDPVTVSEFLNKWLEVSAATEPVEATASANQASTAKAQINSIIKVPEELKKELAKTSRIDSLLCEGETPIYEYATKRLPGSRHVLHNVPKEVNLITLKLQEEDLTKRWHSHSYSAALRLNRKHVNMIHKTVESSARSQAIESHADASEVLLSVMVCRPSDNYIKYCMIKGGVKFQVLGSQKLTELRDKISCNADVMVLGDFSGNPNMPADTRAKDIYKSGYFFINGVFYSDMRDAECIDYSKVIIDWANIEYRKMGPFQSKKMEDTTFLDLTLQLGYPYVYVHQGDCEHILFFTDIRLLNGSDCQDRSQYPICCWFRRKIRTLCMACHYNTAKWVVKKNARLTTDPFFFCDVCFHSFNYNAEGQKIGSFIAQPYCDKVAMI